MSYWTISGNIFLILTYTYKDVYRMHSSKQSEKCCNAEGQDA